MLKENFAWCYIHEKKKQTKKQKKTKTKKNGVNQNVWKEEEWGEVCMWDVKMYRLE